MKKTTTKKRVARKAASKKRRKRNTTIIRAKRIDHLDVSKVHNGKATRRKYRNGYLDLVIRGTAKKTAKGWQVGKKTVSQGKGIAPLSSGYYLDKATGTVFAKRTRNAPRKASTTKPQKKRNGATASPKVKAIREKFSGQRVRAFTEMTVADGAPKQLAKLGKLVLIKARNGKYTPLPNRTVWLCADINEKFVLATTSGTFYDGPKFTLPEVTQVEYEEQKPHLGFPKKTVFFHRLGEEGGKLPSLIGDGKGGIKFRGGSYRIEREGIVD